MPNILIVDDELSFRELLTMIFESAGHAVQSAISGRDALARFETFHADLIVSDVKMPDMDGIELLKAARELYPCLGVVMMSAHANVETAREAFKLGADDFIQKPFDVEELKVIVAKTLEKQALLKENQAFKRAQRHLGGIQNIIGRSEKMQAVYQMIDSVAAVHSTVLITGESGTGKELVARAIHDLSARAEKPFVSINCGAFAETLLESELFGYVKGSFTGANANRKGLFETADHGTIFLDEVGEMSTGMQVKLLRVLQEKCVRPVGGHEEIPFDTRVVAATNRDLQQMIKEGTFRKDLFYRISVIPITLPALRDRDGDLPELINYFLKKYCDAAGKNLSINQKTIAVMEKYSWFGNVRELEHTIERAVALERTGEIQPESLPDHITLYNPERTVAEFRLPDSGINLSAHLDSLEKIYVTEALSKSCGNQTRAAELLQMPVRSLRHLLDKHRIRSLSAIMRENGKDCPVEIKLVNWK